MKLGKDGVVRESPRLPTRLPQHPQAKLPHGTVHCQQSQPGQTHGHDREAEPPGLHPQPTGGKRMTCGRCPRSTRTPKPRLEGQAREPGQVTALLTGPHSPAWRGLSPPPLELRTQVSTKPRLSGEGPNTRPSATERPPPQNEPREAPLQAVTNYKTLQEQLSAGRQGTREQEL